MRGKADGRNHQQEHRVEYNETMGLWVCGCGWKGKTRRLDRGVGAGTNEPALPVLVPIPVRRDIWDVVGP